MIIPKSGIIGKEFVIRFGKKWENINIDIYQNPRKEKLPWLVDKKRTEVMVGDIMFSIREKNRDEVVIPLIHNTFVAGEPINILTEGKYLVAVHVFDQAEEQKEEELVDFFIKEQPVASTPERIADTLVKEPKKRGRKKKNL